MACHSIEDALRDIADGRTDHVDLSNAELSDADLEHLCTALQDDTRVASLGLSGNNIGPEGAKHIAEMLKSNRYLQTLDLNVNRIADDGALALSHALRHNNTLAELLLYGNCITMVGDNHLLYALQHNLTLTFLDLEYDPLCSDGGLQRAIQDRVRENAACSPPSPTKVALDEADWLLSSLRDGTAGLEESPVQSPLQPPTQLEDTPSFAAAPAAAGPALAPPPAPAPAPAPAAAEPPVGSDPPARVDPPAGVDPPAVDPPAVDTPAVDPPAVDPPAVSDAPAPQATGTPGGVEPPAPDVVEAAARSNAAETNPAVSDPPVPVTRLALPLPLHRLRDKAGVTPPPFTAVPPSPGRMRLVGTDGRPYKVVEIKKTVSQTRGEMRKTSSVSVAGSTQRPGASVPPLHTTTVRYVSHSSPPPSSPLLGRPATGQFADASTSWGTWSAAVQYPRPVTALSPVPVLSSDLPPGWPSVSHYARYPTPQLSLPSCWTPLAPAAPRLSLGPAQSYSPLLSPGRRHSLAT